MSQKMKVLIVDDEPFNVDYLEQRLEDLDYQIITAADGQEALDKIKSNQPDLILLDLMMPVMDGFEFLHHLRTGVHAHIPVIVATARELSDDERSRLSNAAQHIIEKQSHTRQQLLELIGDQIREMVAP